MGLRKDYYEHGKARGQADGLRPTRRSVIAGTSMALLALNALLLPRSWGRSRGGKPHQPSQPSSSLPPPASLAHYVATLNTGSALYTFDSANAVDQGNYIGAYVQQKS